MVPVTKVIKKYLLNNWEGIITYQKYPELSLGGSVKRSCQSYPLRSTFQSSDGLKEGTRNHDPGERKRKGSFSRDL